MSNYKCLLVGDRGTGKTSLLKRLTTGEFSVIYSVTVGYEVQHLTIRSKDSASELILDVWHMSGQATNGDLLKGILSGVNMQ